MKGGDNDDDDDKHHDGFSDGVDADNELSIVFVDPGLFYSINNLDSGN